MTEQGGRENRHSFPFFFFSRAVESFVEKKESLLRTGYFREKVPIRLTYGREFVACNFLLKVLCAVPSSYPQKFFV